MTKRQLSKGKKRKDEKNISSDDGLLFKKTKKLRYPLLTIILVAFILILIRGILVNSVKLYSFRAKVSKLEKINKIAHKKNLYLRDELEKYTSNSGVEALARNRLQFSKEDETLIIIKNTQQDNDDAKKDE